MNDLKNKNTLRISINQETPKLIILRKNVTFFNKILRFDTNEKIVKTLITQVSFYKQTNANIDI